LRYLNHLPVLISIHMNAPYETGLTKFDRILNEGFCCKLKSKNSCRSPLGCKLHPENEGSTVLRNDILPHHYTASQPEDLILHGRENLKPHIKSEKNVS